MCRQPANERTIPLVMHMCVGGGGGGKSLTYVLTNPFALQIRKQGKKEAKRQRKHRAVKTGNQGRKKKRKGAYVNMQMHRTWTCVGVGLLALRLSPTPVGCALDVLEDLFFSDLDTGRQCLLVLFPSVHA